MDQVELEILKAYIKNNLAKDFIKSFKFPIRVPNFFNQKLNMSLKLYINHQGLNNWTIKNKYPLFLVRESLNRLDQACHFT